MTTYQFACPNCTAQFQAENPTPGQLVACPQCASQMEIPADLPPPLAADSTQDAAAGSFIPFDFREESLATVRLGGRRRKPKPRAEPVPVRHLSRSERTRRQQRRSIFLMIVGTIVLLCAVIALSRF